MATYLETERLILREFTPADEQNLFDLDSDPAVVEFLTKRPSTREEVLAALERIEKLRIKFQGRFGVWAVTERSSGEFIGFNHGNECPLAKRDGKMRAQICAQLC